MTTMQMGTIQLMTVLRKSDQGYILQKGKTEVFLSEQETTRKLLNGDKVDVFVYMDKQDQIVATMNLPQMVIGTYGWASVVKVVPNLGVFVHIGSSIEVLVSVDDLPIVEAVWPDVGDKLYVTLGQDKKGRLLAIPASEEQLRNEWEFADDVKLNDRVSGYVYLTSKEGSAMLTERGNRAFIHHTEREREPRLGEYVNGRVIDVKEDGTLNVSLLPFKHERIADDAEAILTYLKQRGGVMVFHDKSSPESIQETFHMSKSAFKRAMGRLMKQRQIIQEDGYTKLIDK